MHCKVQRLLKYRRHRPPVLKKCKKVVKKCQKKEKSVKYAQK